AAAVLLATVEGPASCSTVMAHKRGSLPSNNDAEMVAKPRRNSVKPGLSSRRSCNCSVVGTALLPAMASIPRGARDLRPRPAAVAARASHSPDIQSPDPNDHPEISYFDTTPSWELWTRG